MNDQPKLIRIVKVRKNKPPVQEPYIYHKPQTHKSHHSIRKPTFSMVGSERGSDKIPSFSQVSNTPSVRKPSRRVTATKKPTRRERMATKKATVISKISSRKPTFNKPIEQEPEP